MYESYSMIHIFLQYIYYGVCWYQFADFYFCSLKEAWFMLKNSKYRPEARVIDLVPLAKYTVSSNSDDNISVMKNALKLEWIARKNHNTCP